MREHGTVMFGPLSELANDPSVTDMAVTCDGRVWADRGAGMEEYHLRAPLRTPQVVREFAVQLCSQLGRRLDDARPIADASSIEGIRVHAVIEPLVAQGAAISIRLPDRTSNRLETLGQAGLFPPQWLAILTGLVRQRATLLITGGTGAGKTTLLKALLGLCEPTERLVTVEEVRELGGLEHADMVSLVTREANVEGAGEIGLPQLVKATLRMRPDRVVLGECRGEEIVDLLRAFNSGHHGGMTTLHADGVERVPSRLVSLGLLAGVEPRALAMLAEGAFDAVLHLERERGARRIAQIGRLESCDGQLEGRMLASWQGPATTPHVSQDWQEFAAKWAGDSAPTSTTRETPIAARASSSTHAATVPATATTRTGNIQKRSVA